MLLSYSVTNGQTWNDITMAETSPNGDYSVTWLPSATGYFLVRSSWAGNATYPASMAVVNLAVTSFKEQNVFSVASNSTVSNLFFNSTSGELTFTVSAPSGTKGVVDVAIAKSLVADITGLKVYLDGNQLNYAATPTSDAWLLHVEYSHSGHTVRIGLGSQPNLRLPNSLLIEIATLCIGAVTIVGLIALRYRRRSTSLKIAEKIR
jgi:hypothetical protein